MRIREVKREIRVLGLYFFTVRRRRFFIGIIQRGKYLLDGVIFGRLRNSKSLVNIIKSSEYYPELRAILIDFYSYEKCKISCSIEYLFKNTRLPVMAVAYTKRGIDLLREKFNNAHKNSSIILYSVGIKRPLALKLLEVCKIRKVPESIRIAKLLAKALVSNV